MLNIEVMLPNCQKWQYIENEELKARREESPFILYPYGVEDHIEAEFAWDEKLDLLFQAIKFCPENCKEPVVISVTKDAKKTSVYLREYTKKENQICCIFGVHNYQHL